MKKLAVTFAAVLLLVLASSSTANASGRKSGEAAARGGQEGGVLDQAAGIRISNVVVNTDNFDVTFDVTEFLSSSYPYATAWLGPITFFGYIVAPAIEFGDGDTRSPNPFYQFTGIPFVTTTTYPTVNAGTRVVRVYRGSFSHTYPGEGDYTIRVNSVCCAGSPANTVTSAGALSTVITSPFFYTYRFIYNTLPFTIQRPSLLEIPTASTAGLVALGLALLAAGFVVLRRS